MMRAAALAVFFVAAPLTARPPSITPGHGELCAEARALVERALALEFQAPCGGECLRQKHYFYARAVNLCPNDAVAQNNLGDVLEHAGDLPAARAHYERALAADRGLAAAHFGLGDVAFAQGAYGEAAEAYERGLGLAPDDGVSRCRLRLARALANEAPITRDVAKACLANGVGTRGPDPVLVPAARIPLRMRFVTGKTEPPADARAEFEEIASVLADVGTRVRIEVHATDGGLALRRAERVRDALCAHGLDPARVETRGIKDVPRDGVVELIRIGAAEPPQPHLALAAIVLVEDADGRLQPLPPGGTLGSGTRYGVRFSTTTRGHVYVVQEDGAGHLTRLFPNPAYGSGVNPVRESVDYFLPGGEQLFQLDDTVGTERIYVMASRFAARDVEDVIGRIETAENAAGRDAALHEMVLQVRSRGVAGVVGPRTSPDRGALEAAFAHADDDSVLSVIEFRHVRRSQ
jgi:hypothetical protein